MELANATSAVATAFPAARQTRVMNRSGCVIAPLVIGTAWFQRTRRANTCMRLGAAGVGYKVLDSLVYAGEIDRRSGEFQVFADRHDQGSIFCWLSGGTGREQNTFLEAVRQILRPIDNPRYLLARPRFWRWFREDYFCVPEVLARKKEYAEFFAKRWRKTVGRIQLVFTRTPEGRACCCCCVRGATRWRLLFRSTPRGSVVGSRVLRDRLVGRERFTAHHFPVPVIAG